MAKSKEPAVHPGVMLGEWLDENSMSPEQLEAILECSPQQGVVSLFIEGVLATTLALDRSLENATGVPANLWWNMQRLYNKSQGRCGSALGHLHYGRKTRCQCTSGHVGMHRVMRPGRRIMWSNPDDPITGNEMHPYGVWVYPYRTTTKGL